MAIQDQVRQVGLEDDPILDSAFDISGYALDSLPMRLSRINAETGTRVDCIGAIGSHIVSEVL